MNSRMPSSSSTTSIIAMATICSNRSSADKPMVKCARRRALARYLHHENRSTVRMVVRRQRTAVQLDDASSDGEAQAGAMSSFRVESLEDFDLLARRQARSVVTNLEA